MFVITIFITTIKAKLDRKIICKHFLSEFYGRYINNINYFINRECITKVCSQFNPILVFSLLQRFVYTKWHFLDFLLSYCKVGASQSTLAGVATSQVTRVSHEVFQTTQPVTAYVRRILSILLVTGFLVLSLITVWLFIDCSPKRKQEKGLPQDDESFHPKGEPTIKSKFLQLNRTLNAWKISSNQ